jgi:hypothetical protein
MTDIPESDEAPDDAPEPIKPAAPKRGAFPTPKAEIESAKPYIPDIGEKDDDQESKPSLPTDADDRKED